MRRSLVYFLAGGTLGTAFGVALAYSCFRLFSRRHQPPIS